MDYSGVVAEISPRIAKIYNFNERNKIQSTGTGFLYKESGLLVTCDHVLDKHHSLMCRFSGEDTFYTLKVAMSDHEHDLALLKIEIDRKPLPQGKDEEIVPGMPVIFSGFPLSLNTLTTHQGILSAITTDAVGVTTYLIDGTVNSGNSGCPLMNARGEVIGVVNAKRRERSDLLDKVESLSLGAISIHGLDLVEIHQALISNVQLGIGYAVPAAYIPEHKEISKPTVKSKSKRTSGKNKRSHT